MTALHFSIIIPHRDDLRGLARSLAAVSRMAGGRHRFEVIVIDNGSVGGPRPIEQLVAAQPQPAQIAVEPTPGAGPARNLGTVLAKGSILLFLDCDCAPEPDWLDQLADALARHHVVGGPMRVHLEAAAIGSANTAELFDLLFGFQSKRSFLRDGLLLSGNLAVPRAVFDAVGPFRSHTSEDRDWCVRARRAGYNLALCQAASVRHRALDDERTLQRRWMRITRESYVFYREQGFSRMRWLAYCLVVGASPIVHGFRVLRDGRLRGVSATRRMAVIRLLLVCRWRRCVAGLGLLLAAA